MENKKCYVRFKGSGYCQTIVVQWRRLIEKYLAYKGDGLGKTITLQWWWRLDKRALQGRRLIKIMFG